MVGEGEGGREREGGMEGGEGRREKMKGIWKGYIGGRGREGR